VTEVASFLRAGLRSSRRSPASLARPVRRAYRPSMEQIADANANALGSSATWPSAGLAVFTSCSRTNLRGSMHLNWI
jgi:hypothetical protein